jgi:ATP-dependent RNA helicase RhlE
MKFDKFGLDPNIHKALDEIGFKKTTDIQYKAIRSILTGSDVMAIAQTGTGKTAAYVIPIIHQLILRKPFRESFPCALVLVPTRELASQVDEVFKSIGRFTSLKSLAVYGGTDQDYQINALRSGVQILICTPGRLFDLRSQGHIDLQSISTLVLDEADQMLKLGFYKDVTYLVKYLPTRRQTLFFSATIDLEIKKLAYTLVHKPIRIELSPQNPISKNISHCRLNVSMDDKRFFLQRLINENKDSRIMVFVRTQVRAERVQAAMDRVGITTLVIHGGKEQKDRESAIANFKNGSEKILIATDVSARGIDIPNVDIVVNYDVPDINENYVHRIGRTGRGMAKGLAYTFVAQDEQELIIDIESYITISIPTVDLDEHSYDDIKKIADPDAVTMDKIQDLVDEIDQEYQVWDKTRKKKK